jgi:hypothetical protein
MERSDFSYHPLSEAAYEAIISAGEVFRDAGGNIIRSPLHGHDNWAAAEAAAKAGNVDLRALLAATLFEDHHGTDPAGGTELAKVFNFGGIKWAGQPGAFDSGIPYPRNEGIGNYAGFHDFGGFVAELVRTLNNEYIGDAFRAGDLARAWGIYVGGPNNPNMAAGHSRVDQWQYYLSKFPAEGEATVVTGQDVYGEDLITIMAAHENERISDGTLDSWNAPHLWQGWCQASVEGVRAAAGLEVIHRGSAADQLDVVMAQGLLQQGRPEHGGICMWGRSFDPYGHTCLWDEERGAFLSTLYDPSRIGYFYSDVWYNALAGWWRAPGVVAARRDATPQPPAPPPPEYVLVDGSAIPIPLWAWSRWDALNTMGTPLDHVGAINPDGLALPTYGYPMKNELVLPTGRKLMFFERAVMATQSAREPWNVVTLSAEESRPYVDY